MSPQNAAESSIYLNRKAISMFRSTRGPMCGGVCSPCQDLFFKNYGLYYPLHNLEHMSSDNFVVLTVNVTESAGTMSEGTDKKC